MLTIIRKRIIVCMAAFYAGLLMQIPILAVEPPAQPQSKSAWEKQFDLEKKWRDEGLALIPYRSNYFFPFSYNTSPHATSTQEEQNKEAKFQISIKVLLWENIMDYDAHLYFGYTQLSMWEIYDQERSAPFRETNYEPETFLTLNSQKHMGPVVLRQTDIGLVHQSNGSTEPDSRSWNRIYGRFHFDWNDLAVTARPWYRIPESESEDDNPDIEKYMGYGDLQVSYFLRNHILTVMFRNNLRSSGNKGAVQVDYSFPLTRILTGLVQVFSGYGETLIDYNHPVNRFSIGFALSSWR